MQDAFSFSTLAAKLKTQKKKKEKKKKEKKKQQSGKKVEKFD